MLTGYLDGLLGVSLKGEETECMTTLDNAQYSFNDGLFKMQRTLDFWMPFNRKSQLFTEGINEIFAITPNMIKDLSLNCNIVGEDGDVILAWQRRNPDLGSLVLKVSANITKNILTVSTTMIGATASLVAGSYYDSGHQIGHMVDTLIH